MLKVSTNPKITCSIEMDCSFEFELKINTVNCSDLNKRMFLVGKFIDALEKDLNRTSKFVLEANQSDLFGKKNN